MIMGVRSVIEKSLVQTLLWSLNGVCYALWQGTLSTFSQSTQMNRVPAYAGSYIVTCDGLVSIQGEPKTLIRLAPWEPDIFTGLMRLRGTKKRSKLNNRLHQVNLKSLFFFSGTKINNRIMKFCTFNKSILYSVCWPIPIIVVSFLIF